MRRIQFVNGYYYHIFNRGVDKRVIFQDHADFWRFYASMYLFNDKNFKSPGGKSIFSHLTKHELSRDAVTTRRDVLVRIASFCLISNHFHMLVQQIRGGGISTFLNRMGKGYARYFNKRYERSGRLFQSEFQAVLVKREAQFLHLPRYIHLNALDLTNFAWRDGAVTDWQSASRFLDQYPWSSHHVYLGGTQSLPVVEVSLVKELFPVPKMYASFLKSWSGRRVSVTTRDWP